MELMELVVNGAPVRKGKVPLYGEGGRRINSKSLFIF